MKIANTSMRPQERVHEERRREGRGRRLGGGEVKGEGEAVWERRVGKIRREEARAGGGGREGKNGKAERIRNCQVLLYLVYWSSSCVCVCVCVCV